MISFKIAKVSRVTAKESRLVIGELFALLCILNKEDVKKAKGLGGFEWRRTQASLIPLHRGRTGRR